MNNNTIPDNQTIKDQPIKYLILGSKGMLGGQFLKLFGSQAVGWDREECDITNFEDLKDKILRLKPTAVINCVAFNDVDAAEDKPDIAFKLNVEAVGYLAKISKTLDIPLVHFSTNYVFDGKKGEYTESDEPNPISIYGKSKHMGEIELAKNAQKYYLVRLSVLFGPEGESMLSKKSFVEIMMDMAKKESEIQAVDDEIFSLTYSFDLVRVVELLLKKNKPYGIYHITNSGQASWYDFAKEIFKLKKLDVVVKATTSQDFVRKAKRPLKSVLVNTKIKSLRSWQKALNDFLISNF